MQLIVGLGNPGQRYVWTPHNLGFHVLDLLSAEATAEPPMQSFTRIGTGQYYVANQQPKVPVKWKPFARAQIAHGYFENNEVTLAKPGTYMNDSGRAVRFLLEQQALSLTNLIVVLDDFSLPWGCLRIRQQGSSGGHKGLASIIDSLGTNEFTRVRVGVQPNNPMVDLSEYVLTPLKAERREFAVTMVGNALEAIRAILKDGPAWAMGMFNNKVFVG